MAASIDRAICKYNTAVQPKYDDTAPRIGPIKNCKLYKFGNH